MIAISLIVTALGGFYLSTIPSYNELKILYGFWGCSTVFLFWSAMIKATRLWGGMKNQGKAFGLLEAGRGFVAACFGLLGVLIFANLLNEFEMGEMVFQQSALQSIILLTSCLILLIGIVVLFLLKFDANLNDKSKNPVLKDYILVLNEPKAWLMMIIVLSGYIG